jgi:O-antigen/teichoic acid export membrane protein
LSNNLVLPRAAAQQWLGALVSGVISVALMVWLARQLGPREFAVFGATLNAALILMVLLDGGWSELLYRELAIRNPSESALRAPEAALAHTLTAFVPCAVLLAFFTTTWSVAVSAVLCMSAAVLMNQRSARMRAAGNFSGEAVWQVVGRVCSAIAIVVGVSVWVHFAFDGPPVAAWVFLSWAIGLAICLLYTGQLWWRTPSWEGAQSMYPIALSLLLVALSVALMSKADVVLLSSWISWRGITDTDVLTGFAAAARLVDAVMLSVVPLSNIVIAYMRSATSVHGKRPAGFVMWGAFIFWLAGWVVWAIGATGAEIIFNYVFGVAFQGAAPWLKWASLSLPWMMANLLLLPAVIAVDLPRFIARDIIICALVFLVACAVLLSLIGAIGIGVGTACAHALLTILLTRRLSAHTKLGKVMSS